MAHAAQWLVAEKLPDWNGKPGEGNVGGAVPDLEWKAGTGAEHRFEVYSHKVLNNIYISLLLQLCKNKMPGFINPAVYNIIEAALSNADFINLNF